MYVIGAFLVLLFVQTDGQETNLFPYEDVQLLDLSSHNKPGSQLTLTLQLTGNRSIDNTHPDINCQYNGAVLPMEYETNSDTSNDEQNMQTQVRLAIEEIDIFNREVTCVINGVRNGEKRVILQEVVHVTETPPTPHITGDSHTRQLSCDLTSNMAENDDHPLSTSHYVYKWRKNDAFNNTVSNTLLHVVSGVLHVDEMHVGNYTGWYQCCVGEEEREQQQGSGGCVSGWSEGYLVTHHFILPEETIEVECRDRTSGAIIASICAAFACLLLVPILVALLSYLKEKSKWKHKGGAYEPTKQDTEATEQV